MHCQSQSDTPGDNLCAASVLPYLPPDVPHPASYVYHPSTGSTQEDARALAGAGAPHGTIVVTDHQTAGRGRQDRSWSSPPGCGIYCSLLLRPERPLSDAPLLGIAAAIAAVQAIQSCTRSSPRIKWPNDILLHERKIAGILTETDVQPDGNYALFLGWGLNVNTPPAALPHRPLFPASSLQIETGRRIPRAPLLAAWLHHMTAWYAHWQKGDMHRILETWQAHAYGIGREISIAQHDRRTTGIFQGLAPDGALLLQEQNGRQLRILSGDVGFTPAT